MTIITMPPAHPVAAMFPMLDGDEYAAFVADIAANGQRQPIYLMPDGSILDGRNRWHACADLGLEPMCETYHGDDPIGFVISLNLTRRHLSESQRAMIAARLANMHQGQRTDLLSIDKRFSLASASQTLNIGTASTARARQVLASGDDELIAAVDRGEIAVSRAAQIVSNHKTTPEPRHDDGADDEDEEWKPIELPPAAPAILRDAVDTFYHNEAAEVDHPDVRAFDPQVHVGFNVFGQPVDRDGMSDEQYHAAHHIQGIAFETGLEAETKPVTRFNEGMRSSTTPEWYTPQHIIDRVLYVFDEIDLDPCSNSKEYPNIPARQHYTQEDNGLSHQWWGRVYMNPPYGDEIGAWVHRLIHAYDMDDVDEAIALLPARTDTAWFQALWGYTLCFIRGRLKFSGSENSAPFPSVVVYFGPNRDDFVSAFSDIGQIAVGYQRDIEEAA